MYSGKQTITLDTFISRRKKRKPFCAIDLMGELESKSRTLPWQGAVVEALTALQSKRGNYEKCMIWPKS